MTRCGGTAAILVLGFLAPAAAQDALGVLSPGGGAPGDLNGVVNIAPTSDNPSGSRVTRPVAAPTAALPLLAAEQLANQRIAAARKAGRRPDHDSLLLLLSVQMALKDQPGMAATLEEEVAGYNLPADWSEVVELTLAAPGLNDQDAVWLGRLLFAVGAPVSADDASLVGAIASQLAWYGDAANAKAHGGKVDPDPAAGAQADKAALPQRIAAAAAGDGAADAKLAEALYGYGMYPEAVAAARLALQKGGAADASEAPMVLGQALAAQGNYDDAITAFGQAGGGGATAAQIARLWTDYARNRKNPPGRGQG